MRNNKLNEMQLEGACFMECAVEDKREVLINNEVVQANSNKFNELWDKIISGIITFIEFMDDEMTVLFKDDEYYKVELV